MKGAIIVCLTVLVTLTLTLSVPYAEEKVQEDFWSMLKKKVETITPQKKIPVTTAVGGVRGAQEESANALYWKGKETSGEVSETELKKFSEAISLASSKKIDQALKLLNELLAQYPSSPLREDILLAMEKLKGEGAP